MKLQGLRSSSKHAPFSGRAGCSSSLPLRPARPSVRANMDPGRVWGAEQENAAQVRRLISRDRKEFLGNAENDILEKYRVEYGEDSVEEAAAASVLAAQKEPTIAPSTPNPFATSASAAPSNPFGSPPAASPFGAPSAGAYKSVVEPVGLRPDMGPDPFQKETPITFLKSITLTQVVLVGSFSTVILLMLATFNVVLGTGAIRISGI